MTNKIKPNRPYQPCQHDHVHEPCPVPCGPDGPKFISIPGGFICDDERFILNVTKEGNEVPINKVIYDLCEALRTIEHFGIDDFELNGNTLVITDDEGETYDADLSPIVDRITTLETKCETLEARVLKLEECIAEMTNITT